MIREINYKGRRNLFQISYEDFGHIELLSMGKGEMLRGIRGDNGYDIYVNNNYKPIGRYKYYRKKKYKIKHTPCMKHVFLENYRKPTKFKTIKRKEKMPSFKKIKIVCKRGGSGWAMV